MLTRFAPSPTGFLHIGNIRTALISWLYIKKNNGSFILRIDDTNKDKCKEIYEKEIYNDLRWLNINWDNSFKQSTRTKRYAEIINHLKSIGRLYPCYETQQELELKRKIQLRQGLPPIYDRQSMKLTKKQISQHESEGRSPHWRFKINHDKNIEWEDMIAGKIQFTASKLSDPIIIRENNMPTYMLPSTIDDFDYKITDLIRGNDHIANTAIQIQLLQTINAPIPKLAHLSLISTKDNKISKSESNDYEIHNLRKKNIEPETIINYLFNLGRSSHKITASITETIEYFTIQEYKASAKIITNIKDIEHLNHKIIGKLKFNQIQKKIYNSTKKNITEKFWNIFGNNINYTNEVLYWINVCSANFVPTIINKEILKLINNFITEEQENYQTEKEWHEWIKKIKTQTTSEPKQLYINLRMALTGKEKGPELYKIIYFIGYKELLRRINYQAN